MNKLFKQIYTSVKRCPIQLIKFIFLAYTVLWAVLEPLVSFITSAQTFFTGWNKFFILLVLSILIGIYKILLPYSIKLRYNNSIITILFGDLFKQEGLKSIPVSRIFEEINVIESSLQNIVIQSFRESQGGSQGLDNYKSLLSSKLTGKQHEIINRQATVGNEKKYPLGTTIKIDLDQNEYLLFSLTETELENHIPDKNCNIKNLWVALELFWKEARMKARGKSINIPLIGSGVTGINLPPIKILELNITSILNAIIEDGVITSEEIKIILHPKYYDLISLKDIEHGWAKQ